MKLNRITIKTTEYLHLISNLSTMISAGIPILSAVNSLSEEAVGNSKKILMQIYEDLLKGKHLYESFAQFPYVFDDVTVNMIKASEQSGTLDVVLKDLKEQIKKDIAFNRKVRNALTYPFLVMAVFIGILLLILTVVIPKIATVFTELKVTLPLPTKIMFFMSNLLIHQTLYVILTCVLLALGIFALYRYKKKRVVAVLFKLPVVSSVIRDIDLVRFSRSIHLLLNAGISVTSALELSENVVMKKEVAKAISHAKQTVLTGKPMSESLKQNKKIFSGTMIELVQAGEKTGSLDKSMQDISEYFDYKVSDNLSVLTALLEPIMLILVAVMVGTMMVAIIGPIYSLIGQISPH